MSSKRTDQVMPRAISTARPPYCPTTAGRALQAFCRYREPKPSQVLMYKLKFHLPNPFGLAFGGSSETSQTP
eukprot:4938275-Amphidinium_carterae.1